MKRTKEKNDHPSLLFFHHFLHLFSSFSFVFIILLFCSRCSLLFSSFVLVLFVVSLQCWVGLTDALVHHISDSLGTWYTVIFVLWVSLSLALIVFSDVSGLNVARGHYEDLQQVATSKEF
jgi:hypothetical protein